MKAELRPRRVLPQPMITHLVAVADGKAIGSKKIIPLTMRIKRGRGRIQRASPPRN